MLSGELMKILFVSSFLGREYGGAEVSTRLLLNSLTDQGEDVHALTTRRVQGDTQLTSICFIFEVPKRLVTLGNGQIDFFFERRIRHQIEKIKPDVIHVQDTYILPATVKANRKFGIPLVVTIRNSLLDETWDIMFSSPVSTMLKRRNRVILKALAEVDGIIPISRYIQSELFEIGIENARIYQIYNLPPKLEKKTLLSLKDNASSKPDSSVVHLFAPGCLLRFKGFSVLIAAFKDVIKSGANAELTIAGDGPERGNLEKLATRLKVEKHIRFTGRVPFEKIYELYSSCDIVVFPSNYPEPLGRVALEAMFFGKPVIASKVGGIPEMVRDNETGLLVNPNQPQELTDAMLALINNQQLSVKMGERGQQIIGIQFNPEKIIKQHLQVYQACSESRLKNFKAN